jgi:hypothetical protein
VDLGDLHWSTMEADDGVTAFEALDFDWSVRGIDQGTFWQTTELKLCQSQTQKRSYQITGWE